MKKLLTLKEIGERGRNGEYRAICDNGKTYEASYSAEYKAMFFCIPYNVKVLGYVESSIAEHAAEAAELIREING